MSLQITELNKAMVLYKVALDNQQQIPTPNEWINNRTMHINVLSNYQAHIWTHKKYLGENITFYALNNSWSIYMKYMCEHF